jgi:predicted PurR-regulated permease PerM
MRIFRHSDSPDTLETSQVEVTISVKTYVKVALLVVVTIALIAAFRKATHALLLLFTAFFLALALNAPVSWVAKHLPGKRRGSRSLATSLSYLIVIFVLGAFLASLIPPLVKQTHSLIGAAPTLVKDFKSQDSQTGKIIRRYNLEKQVNEFSSQLSDRLKGLGSSAFSTVQKVGSSAFSLVTILVLTFMMLVEGPEWISSVKKVTPRRHHERIKRVSYDMYRVVKGYVNGQVILAAIASAAISPALLILHVSYPIALVFVIFICGLIPMVGHTIGAVIVSSVALFTSTTAGIIVLCYYILYQQLENIFVQPRIQANSTNMSPLLVFASVVVGVSFGGLLGGLVSIPVAGCIRVLILEYLESRNIIDTKTVEQAID